MKVKTKKQLNTLFGLGFIPAALTIGRAAVISRKTLTEDTTCRITYTLIHHSMTDSWTGNIVPSAYITSLEFNLGIIFACGPAIRQFWACKNRTPTYLPSSHRQCPNKDFKKMYCRINQGVILSYYKAQMVGDKVYKVKSIFRSRSPPPIDSSSSSEDFSRVRNSVLNVWERRIKKIFSAGRDSQIILLHAKAFLAVVLKPIS